MESCIMKVTPKIAEEWLEKHNDTNRKLREGVAEQYAEDMKMGRWTECPNSISFYVDGNIADGQHRLWAILESDTTQEFLIVRGLRREAGLNIDTGLGRTIVDNGRISGRDTNLSNTLVACARAVQFGRDMTSMKLSPAARLELVDKYRDACEWAISNGPKAKYLNNAVMLSAIARAWYYEPNKDRLKRFCDVVKNPSVSQGENESAAVSIRTYMIDKAAIASSSAMWADTFMKIQNAIKYFMEGKKLTVIKAVNTEAYPLDGRRVRKK